MKIWCTQVLSQVRTRAGPILNAKLDLHKKFKVPKMLLKLDKRTEERGEIIPDLKYVVIRFMNHNGILNMYCAVLLVTHAY